MSRARVVLAEDHAETAALLHALLQQEFDVLADVADGGALVSAAARLVPDVIVADISMPCLDGIGAAVQIRRDNPGARIVFVTMLGDRAVVERGLATGALGYVLKVAAGEELVAAVHAALAGRRYVSRGLGGVGNGTVVPTAT
jgi:DNA-binding NarL/FixJ family response regulator